MTKLMLILSSISSGLEFWSVNQTSMYENSELKVFKNVKFLGEIFSNWPNDLLGINIYKSHFYLTISWTIKQNKDWKSASCLD